MKRTYKKGGETKYTPADTDLQQFLTVLLEKRAGLRMTQGQVAEQIGMQKQSIHLWEKSSLGDARLKHIFALCRLYDIESIEVPKSESADGQH